MKKRNIVMVVLLTFITFGIYGIVWYFLTRKEMVERGADIPTAWLVFVPIVGFWWLYKYCMGVEKITNGNRSGITLFIIFLLVSVIGMAFTQDSLNKIADAPAIGGGAMPGGAPMGQPMAMAPQSPISEMPAPAPVAQPQASAPVAQAPVDNQTSGSQPPSTPVAG